MQSGLCRIADPPEGARISELVWHRSLRLSGIMAWHLPARPEAGLVAQPRVKSKPVDAEAAG